jgi:agmatine deiminase
MAFDSDNNTTKRYLTGQKIDTTNIKFYVIPGDRYWIGIIVAAFFWINGKRFGC